MAKADFGACGWVYELLGHGRRFEKQNAIRQHDEDSQHESLNKLQRRDDKAGSQSFSRSARC